MLVGVGRGDQMTSFRERLKLPFTCLVDPERQAYKPYQLSRFGILKMMSPVAMWSLTKAFFRVGAGKVVSDPMQQQGEFVIDTQGVVRMAHYPNHLAQRLSLEKAIAELEAISGDQEKNSSA